LYISWHVTVQRLQVVQLPYPAHVATVQKYAAKCTVDLGCVSVSPASSAGSLEVTIDDTLSFNKMYPASAVVQLPHHIRVIRRLISEDAEKTIACSMIKGRLDCCCIAHWLRKLIACSCYKLCCRYH